mmetsp:Transcript_60313/g.132085  ORF Transcript_60313/g.132085 Transcript_60313/m.132085 type:complete len:81 (-) Transcript_60313:151-393(-)
MVHCHTSLRNGESLETDFAAFQNNDSERGMPLEAKKSVAVDEMNSNGVPENPKEMCQLALVIKKKVILYMWPHSRGKKHY